MLSNVAIQEPGSFLAKRHFYPEVLGAKVHPELVRLFRKSSRELIDRHIEKNPAVNRHVPAGLLSYRPHHLLWAGCDLFSVTDGQGRRRMLLIETNSCPSGQKSLPLTDGGVYVADIRFMIAAGVAGYEPIPVYARRARRPLTNAISADCTSWDMLGTNLSYKDGAGLWQTDEERLVMLDEANFSRLGLSAHDLIEAYVQSVMAAVAIDRRACSVCGGLIPPVNSFSHFLFAAKQSRFSAVVWAMFSSASWVRKA
jgi:hypothetical protein